MSWFNSIKGQLTTLAQEVMAETAGPGDDEYVASVMDAKVAVEVLADAQKECEHLNKMCADKDAEILVLRKQISEIQNKIVDSGGGNIGAPMVVAATTASSSGRTSKSPTDQSATLEDSWCWEEGENVKSENDRCSEASSGEMVNITLEEVALGRSNPAGNAKRLSTRQSPEEATQLQKRVQQLEEANRHLNVALEELDLQHNEAMQNVLELKTELQAKLSAVSKDYAVLKKEHADKFINGELELAQLKKQNELLEQDLQAAVLQRLELQRSNDDCSIELKNAMVGLSDLQTLLEKKDKDNIELIERIRAANKLNEVTAEEHRILQENLERVSKELEEYKSLSNKKNSESSTTGSADKQSDDEFIVVREGDAGSSSPATPPSKEELKDKIVQLENKLSELTLENGSLSLKLQDSQMEKELSSNVLKDNLHQQEKKLEEKESILVATLEELLEQRIRNEELKERAAEAIISNEKIKALSEEKQKVQDEIGQLHDLLSQKTQAEQKLYLTEQEKESLELELMTMRTFKDRVQELEEKLQTLTYENQKLKFSSEAETEAPANTDTNLEAKMLALMAENESMRLELEAAAQAKFSQAIAEEKRITDLDADEELEQSFDLGKLRELLSNLFKENINQEPISASDDKEKTYTVVYERLKQIDTLQKSLARMSGDLLELRESKLVWQHEKKTLEADISQYILQCDELMKNNEILLNELDNYKRNKLETISESNEENLVQLETELEECTKLNRTLEEEYAEMNEKIVELEREKQELNKKLVDIQSITEEFVIAESDYKLQIETLELEKCNLQFELNEWNSREEKSDEVKALLAEAETESNSLKNQLERLSKDHADLVNAMQTQNASLMEALRKRDQLGKLLENQEKLALEAQLENERLQSVKNAAEKDFTELQKIVQEKDAQLLQQSEELAEVLGENKTPVERLKSDLKTVEEELNSLTRKHEALLNEHSALTRDWESLKEKCESYKQRESAVTVRIGVSQQDEPNVNFEDVVDELKLSMEELQKEYQDLQERFETQSAELKALQGSDRCPSRTNDESIVRIAKLEAELLTTADLQKTVDSLNYEKQEMIKALQQKHSENMQYYMEIQRLQPIIQSLQQQLANKTCDKCADLKSSLVELRKELEKQRDQIKFLKEKSDILTTNLLTEQTNQKLVHHEKLELMAQNATLRKDLERLRVHLLEMEDMHTKDTVEVHRELEEAKAKMVAVQEEFSKSSNAYTSASIRANQHAETLQAQYALVVHQRDELVAKLSSSEDRESKNQAALCNLQCALEQFQNDKENDIKVATHRIRKELQHQLDKESQLQREMATLNQQLADANQGLRAASRLSDQLEACQLIIASLREEAESLKTQKREIEQQLSLSESCQSDKIDKNLIKSLLIGYVISSSPSDKIQILRMISSVLEFTAGEADRVGLNKQQTSWLGAILGGGSAGTAGNANRDNLVQAFVEFLEQESQPKVNQSNMPNLLSVTNAGCSTISSGSSTSVTPSSRRTSLVSNYNNSNNSVFNSNDTNSAAGSVNATPTPIPIQPLLLNANIIDEFAPTRNSSSILKDILNDT